MPGKRLLFENSHDKQEAISFSDQHASRLGPMVELGLM